MDRTGSPEGLRRGPGAAALRRVVPLLALMPAAVCGGEWQVDRKAPDNEVRFTSRVAAFTFSGVTGRVDGFIYWEGDSPLAPPNQIHFEVDLAGFDTGIGRRDRDMREVLETDKWPKAVYAGEITGRAAVDTTVTAYRVETRGRLSLHGVERAVEVPGLVVMEEGRARVEARFSLKLADYGIEAPSLAAFVKVSQEIVVEVSFRLAPGEEEDR